MPKTTYYTKCDTRKDIISPCADNSVGMLYKGSFEDRNGLYKDRFGRGLIYSLNASSLFTLAKGYVGLTLSFPDNIVDGVYSPLRHASGEINKYILWGVNVGQYKTIVPGIEVSLTKNGIEFKILSSIAEFAIIDTYSNIRANSDVFFEFVWDKDGLDNFSVDAKITMAYRVNGQDIIIGNPPIANDSILNRNFCLLNTPFLNSGLECTLKSICIRDGITREIEDEWQSSSATSSSFSSASSMSYSSQSTSSSNSPSSTSSIEEALLGKYMVSCEFSKLYGGTEVGGNIWVSNDRGASWTEKTKFSDGTDIAGFWGSTAISKDGKYQLIGGLFRSNGVIGSYPVAKSSNYGVTWSKINITPSFSYDTQFTVAASGNGQYQTLCPLLTTASATSGMKILVSSNYGVTFAQKAITRRWSAIAMSNDGRYQTACADGDKIYVSNNFGNAWVVNASVPTANWLDVSISSSGQYQCAISWSHIIISNDYGVTWTTIASSAGTANWGWTDMSSDGKTIIVSNGYMRYGYNNNSHSSQYYYSQNYGVMGSWSYIDLPQWNTPTNIFGFATSWDGKEIHHFRGVPDARLGGSISNFPIGGLAEGGDAKKWSAIALNK